MKAEKPDRKNKPVTRFDASAPRRNSTRTEAGTDRPPVSEVKESKPPNPRLEIAPSARLVSEVRSGLGVTREIFARLTGFSVRAIPGWEAGRPLSEAALRRIKEMKRLRDLLAEGMRPEFIPQWLESPSEGPGGLKPVEVLERGETDRRWRTALLIGSGMPT